jgi:hypothetical protein
MYQYFLDTWKLFLYDICDYCFFVENCKIWASKEVFIMIAISKAHFWMGELVSFIPQISCCFNLSQLVSSFHHTIWKRYLLNNYIQKIYQWKEWNPFPPMRFLEVKFLSPSFLTTIASSNTTKSCGCKVFLTWHRGACIMGNWTCKCLICFTPWSQFQYSCDLGPNDLALVTPLDYVLKH